MGFDVIPTLSDIGSFSSSFFSIVLVLVFDTPIIAKGSIRDVEMLPPVLEALRDQRKATWGKSDYVFLNKYGRPLKPCPTRKHTWTRALKKAGIDCRTMM